MRGEGQQAGAGAHDVELARALVPELLGRIEGSTQRLGGIEARLVSDAGRSDPAEALGDEAREAEGLGWLLGWIASGLGAELLLERHEPRALTLALELVDSVLRQRGSGLELVDIPCVSRAGGWRLAWALAGLAWRAGVERGGVVALRVERDAPGEEASLVLDGVPCEVVRAHARALERELQGTRAEDRGATSWSWSFPAAWLEAAS